MGFGSHSCRAQQWEGGGGLDVRQGVYEKMSGRWTGEIHLDVCHTGLITS